MTKPSDFRKLSRAIKGQKDTEARGYFAVIGKKDGTVSTGIPGIVWVTVIATGQEIQVINRRYVPNRRGIVVFVGSDKQSANKTEVLYMLNTDSATNGGVPTIINTVPPHNHSWPGENTTWVYSEQIMPLLAKPIAGTLTIRIYPGVIRDTDGAGWVYIASQVVDVSGDVPGSGALWITLQANDDGSVDYVVGTGAASRSALDETDVPEATTGRPIWAVILEAGYNELFQNTVRNDFLDLRFTQGALSVIDATEVTYTPLDVNDWDYLEDPGNSADALDQLADRVKSMELYGAGGTPMRELISEQTPSGTGTVTFSSIPTSYKKLTLEWLCRSTVVATFETMAVQFNGDTTAGNYRSSRMLSYAAGSLTGGGGNDGIFTESPGASAPSNSFSHGIARLPYYFDTNSFKKFLTEDSYRRDASSVYLVNFRSSVEWKNTAAITRIDIILASGNFVSGSIFRLYGEN